MLIHIVAYLRTSFLLIAEWYSIVWIYHTFFIHSSVGGHLYFFHFLFIMGNAAMNIHEQVLYKFECIFSFILAIYLGMEMMNHMVTLCLTVWGTDKLFSKADASFYISTSNAGF